MRKEMLDVEKLIDLRERAGFLQVEMANEIGVTRETYNHWERRCSEPSATYLIRICKVLGIEKISELIKEFK